MTTVYKIVNNTGVDVFKIDFAKVHKYSDMKLMNKV